MKKKPQFDFNAQTPEAAAYRYEQAHVDADIEGMARDPKLDALHEQWEQDNVPHEERICRLIELAKSGTISNIAAE